LHCNCDGSVYPARCATIFLLKQLLSSRLFADGFIVIDALGHTPIASFEGAIGDVTMPIPGVYNGIKRAEWPCELM
jgi:hypothetical protein